MSVFVLPTCPTECSGSLNSVAFNECAPELHYGEVEWLYVARADASDFTDITNIAEWTPRLSEDSVDADAIRPIHVIGEMPEPEQNELTISGDRIVTGYKTFTLSFEIDETNDTNYEFLLNTECNLRYKIWFATADGMLYGGNEGIEAVIKLNQIIPRERTELVKFTGNVKWKSKFSPLRCTNPNV